ncbi:MAG: DUF370 domain-containing protein [Deltaproteobacteria bacterium]|jgi:regulator of extracellular matrix RemA (YlzA/DUF370 family)
MMIAVGDKHFIDSEYIVEILQPMDNRAKIISRTAAKNGRLINTTGGQKIRSIIKLKSKHIVLSALEVKTLKSKIKRTTLSAGSGNSVRLRPKHSKKQGLESKASKIDDRRMEPDRRNFSYTCHIPERRSGTQRRK